MTNKKANKLIDQSSPYLLQHAYNPVDWHPWGDEALNKAKREDKLLIISIGYSACHWCHVMEHESFEDSLVAKIMNDNFVAIKVDREERPDVDEIYMTACQLVSGSGGWPLNAFALPDGRPVWAGTYFPKGDWLNILEQFAKIKAESPEKLEDSAVKLTQGINALDQLELNTAPVEFTVENLAPITERFLNNIDFINGGRKGQNKFPMPNNYEYLLKYAHLTGHQKASDAYQLTLEKMARGGIFDQIGGGFARYAVDDIWLVPHFEKMLYDNSQLVSLYSDAYKKDKNPLFKDVVEKTLDFIDRELSSPENGFYSALDADSEGEEGKFYVWSESEIDSIIQDTNKAAIYKDYYDVSKLGNWEHKNVLNRAKDIDEIVKKFTINEKQLNQIISESNRALMKHRDTRIRPGLDDKILTSWNALMLKGYVDAYEAFGETKYLRKALDNANFLVDNQIDKDFRLNRNFKDGKSSINAFLDDYAITIDAFISLYQASFDESWLDKADRLLTYTLDHFSNESTAMFRYTSDLDPPLVAQKTEYSDNVIPAANSIMGRNLFNLGTLLYKPAYIDRSKQMLKNMDAQISKTSSPNFYSNWLQLFYDHANPPYEIAILGPEADEIRNEIAKSYLGNALLLGGETEGTLSLLKDKLQEGETYIYVCKNKVCKFPVQDPEAALKLLED